MSLASPAACPAKSLPPWAAMVLLCPNAWLPTEWRTFSEEDADDRFEEDYSVCLLRAAEGRGTVNFPGGELSPVDRGLAAANRVEGDTDDVFLALRLAAIRRTFESAGLMVAANPPPGFARHELQKILLREGPLAFHAFLDDWGIRLRPDDLVELAWLYMPNFWGAGASPQEEHMFLAQVPSAEELLFARAEPTEDFSGFCWVTPSQALRLHAQGELHTTLTQWYVLHELARCLPRLHLLPDLVAAPPVEDAPLWCAAAVEVRMVRRPSGHGEGAFLLLPGDEEHPSSPGVAGQRHRILLEPTRRADGAAEEERTFSPRACGLVQRGLRAGRGSAELVQSRL